MQTKQGIFPISTMNSFSFIQFSFSISFCFLFCRVKHLTILLAEAEQDLVKLTQLNDVLKEEMRRNERSTEREQHLHNLEYLKNVVFKVNF